jgi:hypothetical protein
LRFTLGLSLAAILAAADPAGAVLKHYGVHWTTISNFNTGPPPHPNKYPPAKDGSAPVSVGIVDDTNNGSPVLKRLALILETETTIDVPGLAGFLFLSTLSEEGPKKSFTGTGDTDTAIAWGLVTGWSATGGFWCHSSPSNVCTYTNGRDLATREPVVHSSFYDLGTWTFHGTGFTSVPFVHQISLCEMCAGNGQFHLRGRLSAGLVPAVPILGVTLLGASLLFAGARLSRGGRRERRMEEAGEA